jgi:hypothetical protein
MPCAEFVTDTSQTISLDIRDRDESALGRAPQSQRPTDATGRAGDNHDPSVELHAEPPKLSNGLNMSERFVVFLAKRVGTTVGRDEESEGSHEFYLPQ